MGELVRPNMQDVLFSVNIKPTIGTNAQVSTAALGNPGT